MSSPGMTNPALTTAQLTPEYLQQLQAYQDQQKQLNMAKALMNNQADAKTPYAGVANAGSDLTGALALKAFQQNQPQTNAANYLPNDPTAGMKDQTGMPISGAQPGQSWWKGLFNLGGNT